MKPDEGSDQRYNNHSSNNNNNEKMAIRCIAQKF